MSIPKTIKNEAKIALNRYKYMYIKKKKRPLTFHTETIFDNRVWKKIVGFVKRGNFAVWYVLTPVNYELSVGEWRYKRSKKDYEKVLIERYKWLQENGQEIQLHLHLMPMMNFFGKESYKKQKEIFQKALMWLKRNGFNVTKISFGWWSYDDVSVKISQELGLKIIKEKEYYDLHDFDFIRENSPEVLNE